MNRTRAVLKEIVGHFTNQKEAAEKCGVEASILSRIINGGIESPAPKIIAAICENVAVTDARLLAGTYFVDLFPESLRGFIQDADARVAEQPHKYRTLLDLDIELLRQKALHDPDVRKWLSYSATLITGNPDQSGHARQSQEQS